MTTTIDLQALKALKALKAETEREIKALEEILKAEMVAAECFDFFAGDFHITYKQAKPAAAVDVKRLAEEMPEVYNEYRKESVGAWRLTVK